MLWIPMVLVWVLSATFCNAFFAVPALLAALVHSAAQPTYSWQRMHATISSQQHKHRHVPEACLTA
jgi:hypothetical protein